MKSFDSNQALYVTKPSGLKYNGKTYQFGEKLDTRTGIKDVRILRIMFNLRRIGHDVPRASVAVVEPVVVIEPVVAVAVAPVQQLTGNEPQASLVHVGAGWYNVEVYGGVVNIDGKLKGKAAATKWAETNGFAVLTEA